MAQSERIGIAQAELYPAFSLLGSFSFSAIDYTRVLDSQEFLVLQQDRLAAARGAIALNLVAVYKALGGGWQIREGQAFVAKQSQQEMQHRTNWGPLLPETPAAPAEEREQWWWPLW